MDGLEELLLVGSKFFSGGWLLGLLFLWVIRHDVLLPLGKQIGKMDGLVREFMGHTLASNVSRDEIRASLEGIRKALQAGKLTAGKDKAVVDD